MTRGYLIVLAFSWVASSLTLASTIARSATPHAQQKSDGDARQSSSQADAKKKDASKKAADDHDLLDPPSRPASVKGLTKEFLLDQQQIWTSPASVRLSDTQWLLPLSGFTAGLFVTDNDYSKHLSTNPSTISRYKNLSDAGIGAL